MILADYHLHTSFSSDSESPMEEMIRHAVSLGLKTICFTEHHDIDYPVNPDGFDFLLDLPSYKEEIFHIQEHYQETISIKELAEQMNMSPRNFSRIFHKTCGLSPVNYIIKLRIDHACELLQNSSLTVSQVAYACGFQDSNYFTRQFKGISGFSPRDYRRSFR